MLFYFILFSSFFFFANDDGFNLSDFYLFPSIVELIENITHIVKKVKRTRPIVSSFRSSSSNVVESYLEYIQ